MVIMLAALFLAACVANAIYAQHNKNQQELIDRLIRIMEEAVEEE